MSAQGYPEAIDAFARSIEAWQARAEHAEATLKEARRRYVVLHHHLYALPFWVLPKKKRAEPEWLNMVTAIGSLGQALEEASDDATLPTTEDVAGSDGLDPGARR